jgi:hypothetical protein
MSLRVVEVCATDSGNKGSSMKKNYNNIYINHNHKYDNPSRARDTAAYIPRYEMYKSSLTNKQTVTHTRFS